MATSEKGKHGPNTYDNYLAVHRSALKKFAAHATSEPHYTVESHHDALFLRTHFRIETLSGNLINISITKMARVTRRRGRKYCETAAYRYVAYDAATENRLIGYHSPHHNLTAKKMPHHNHHHKHVYCKDRIEYPLPDDEIPHVSDFLDEVIKSF